MTISLEEHLPLVVRGFAAGRVIPFLGAGANLCGRPAGARWQPGQFLPSGRELALHLAENFGYVSEDKNDLVRVSQYVSVMSGMGPLYEELHGLFNTDYPPTSIHRTFARLPALLHAKGYPKGHPERSVPGYQLLVVTTNYDDLMERAFREAGQPFDLLSYEAEGDGRGKFWHLPPDGAVRLVEKPNEYATCPWRPGPVIVKIHGAVDRAASELDEARDSFVITEDQYIDYLTRTDIASLLPVRVVAELKLQPLPVPGVWPAAIGTSGSSCTGSGGSSGSAARRGRFSSTGATLEESCGGRGEWRSWTMPLERYSAALEAAARGATGRPHGAMPRR